jgi:hypothetical protein
MLQTVNGKTMLEDNVYSFGKKAVQVYIPAVSAFYFALGNIWGFPAIEKVTGSLAVLAVFIGTLLGISSKNFDKSGAGYVGNMIVVPKEDGAFTYTLDVKDNIDVADLQDKDSISFKVVPPETP